ncbi:MAG: type I-B CRISPR-associated protein Cas5b [Candidatus Margulisbacteria bacterium]|nr:type I-B CRISPR-associated protein Cas5b [Candidatus Margulisiibacteriota bacterium]
MNNILIFDIWADYAHIKKIFTTMSPLSFPFPGRTAIQGIIGAIIGVDKSLNPEKFIDEDVLIGLSLLSSIKKVVIPHNNLKVTSKIHFSHYEDHKPQNVEFIKDPKYRIYFACKDKNVYEELKVKLESHTSVYTISLGISQTLANYEYIGEYGCLQKTSTNEFCLINSVCDKSSVLDIEFGELKIFTVILPNRMKNDREVIEYKEFIYESDGNPIKIKTNKYYEVSNGENIIFL